MYLLIYPDGDFLLCNSLSELQPRFIGHAKIINMSNQTFHFMGDEWLPIETYKNRFIG